jgi:uncharacterized protein
MANPETAFLGTGWSFPPTFSRLCASVDMVSAETDVRESLIILFSTAWGERVMLPTYGCGLSGMIFQGVTTTLQTEIAASLRQAVLNWEPRIEVLDVRVQPDATIDGLVLVTLDYLIRQTNTRSNLVYPFYLREGTLVPVTA